MNPLIQLKTTPPFLIILTLLCVTLLPKAEAVNPPPPGGYPNFTTAAGDKALKSLTSGAANTAIGNFSLFSVTAGNNNTAVGAGIAGPQHRRQQYGHWHGGAFIEYHRHENTAIGMAALET